MKIAIIVREETMMRCTGGGCMNAFFQQIDSFARYTGREDVELVAFTHNGGDIERKIATLIKKGVDVVHLSSCIRKKDPQYAWLAKKCQNISRLLVIRMAQIIVNNGHQGNGGRCLCQIT